MRPEETLTSSLAFSGRLLRLEVDRVRLPGGGESIREVVRHPGAAVVVPELDGDRLVLVRQYRYAAGREMLELPAGTIAGTGESPLECARRELAEETGYLAAQWRQLGCFFTAPGFSDERIHCFGATGLSPVPGGPAPDADETLEIVVLPRDEVLRLILEGELCDAKSIAGIMLAVTLGHVTS